MARVRAMTAPLDAEYVVRPRGRRAEIDETFTMAPPPVLQRLIHHGAAAADAHVVVEEVEATVAIEGGADHARAVLVAREVGAESHRLTPFVLDHAHRLLGEIDGLVHHDDLGPCPGEQDGGGAAVADARARGPASRHDGDLALE